MSIAILGNQIEALSILPYHQSKNRKQYKSKHQKFLWDLRGFGLMEGRGGYQNKIVTKNKSNTCEELTKHSHFGLIIIYSSITKPPDQPTATSPVTS